MAHNKIYHRKNQIDKLNSLFHDYWFDIDDIIHNKENKFIKIKFITESRESGELLKKILCLKKYKIPRIITFLCIENVIEYTLEETEDIKIYNFNGMQYSEKTKTINFATGIPLLFQVKISDFKVAVEFTKKIIEYKEIWTI